MPPRERERSRAGKIRAHYGAALADERGVRVSIIRRIERIVQNHQLLIVETWSFFKAQA